MFDSAYMFKNGTAVVGNDGKYGLINTKGDYILKPEYDKIYDTKAGFYIADGENGDMLLYDSGEKIADIPERGRLTKVRQYGNEIRVVYDVGSQNTPKVYSYFIENREVAKTDEMPIEQWTFDDGAEDDKKYLENGAVQNKASGMILYNDGYDVSADKIVTDPETNGLVMGPSNDTQRLGRNLYIDDEQLKNRKGNVLYKGRVFIISNSNKNQNGNIFFVDRQTELVGIVSGEGKIITPPVYHYIRNDGDMPSTLFYKYSTDGYAYVVGDDANYIIDGENNIVLDMNKIQPNAADSLVVYEQPKEYSGITGIDNNKITFYPYYETKAEIITLKDTDAQMLFKTVEIPVNRAESRLFSGDSAQNESVLSKNYDIIFTNNGFTVKIDTFGNTYAVSTDGKTVCEHYEENADAAENVLKIIAPYSKRLAAYKNENVDATEQDGKKAGADDIVYNTDPDRKAAFIVHAKALNPTAEYTQPAVRQKRFKNTVFAGKVQGIAEDGIITFYCFRTAYGEREFYIADLKDEKGNFYTNYYEIFN